MKTNMTTRIIAAALMLVVMLAAFTPFIAFSEDPVSAGAGKYILRFKPIGEDYADFDEMTAEIKDSGGTTLETFDISAAGDWGQWGERVFNCTLEDAPALIAVKCRYKFPDLSETYEPLEYQAAFSEWCDMEIASDVSASISPGYEIPFCYYSIEYAERKDGTLPPLHYVDADGSSRVQNEYRLFDGSLGRVGDDGEIWIALRTNRIGETSIDSSIPIPPGVGVNLVLCDDIKLDCDGIMIMPGSSLTIWQQRRGSGSLISKGGKTTGVGTDDQYYAGINVMVGSSLTINGGHITAEGNYHSAGIGSEKDLNSGDITINGGVVKATGGDAHGSAVKTGAGAGIGGGWHGRSGNITITGGSVEAVSGKYGSGAAGIGGGEEAGSGPVTISGGNVRATGNYGGAGIGGGYNGDSDTIEISGGHVEACSSNRSGGAGIGGGENGINGAVTISGDYTYVVAKSEFSGAGIGAGWKKPQGGAVTISGGTVEAVSKRGAGIGGGADDKNGYDGGTVAISGADTNVVAMSGDGAGIGGGGATTKTGGVLAGTGGNGGSITIDDGLVYAVSLNGGAGIGGGTGGSGGNITINNGYVIASGGNSRFDWIRENGFMQPTDQLNDDNFQKYADEYFYSAIADIFLELLTSEDYAGAGIGGGSKKDSGVININGGVVVAKGGTNDCSAVGWGYNGSTSVNSHIYREAKVTYGRLGGDSAIIEEGVISAGSPESQKTGTAKNKSYAKIEPGDITVIFDVGGIGTAPEPLNVKAFDKISPPADPTAEGHIFDGWYKDPECIVPFDFNQPVTEDTTVYGKWADDSFALTVRKIWPEGVNLPDEISIIYNNKYEAGKTKRGVLRLSGESEWTARLSVTPNSVITLEESFTNGFEPKSWTYYSAGEPHTLSIDPESKAAVLDMRTIAESGSIEIEDAALVLENKVAWRYSVQKEWRGCVPMQYEAGGHILEFDWTDVIDHVGAVLQHRTSGDGEIPEIWVTVETVTLAEAQGGEFTWWNGEFETVVDDPSAYRVRELISNEGRDGNDRFLIDSGLTKKVLLTDEDADGSGEDPSFVFKHVTHTGREFTGTFHVIYDLDNDGNVTVTNTYGTVLSAEKKWEGENKDTLKPDSIDVVLQHKERTSLLSPAVWNTVETQTLNEENGWKVIFERTCPDNETPEEYWRVRELGQDGKIAYAQNDSDTPADGDNTAEFTMTDKNGAKHELSYTVTYDTYSGGHTVITNHGKVYSVQKQWEGLTDQGSFSKPYFVNTVLERLESRYGNIENWTEVDRWMLRSDNQWRHDFSPVWEKGEYRIRELNDDGAVVHAQTDKDGDGSEPVLRTYVYYETGGNYIPLAYKVAYQEDENNNTTTITNTQAGPFTVKKVWDTDKGGTLKPDSVNVVLLSWYANEGGNAGYAIVGEPVTLSEQNGWQAEFDTIPDSSYISEDYIIRELDKDGKVVINGAHEGETIYKMYSYEGSEERKTSAAYTVGSGTNSRDINYSTSYVFDSRTGETTVTNKLDKTIIQVEKKWENGDSSELKADSVKVVLQKKQGNAWQTVGDPAELSAANGWTTFFTPEGLTEDNRGDYCVRELEPAEDGGDAKIIYASDDADKPQDASNIVTYKITTGEGEDAEEQEQKYTVSYSVEGDMTTITNKLEGIQLKVEKKWDIDLEKKDRPDKIEAVIQEKKEDDKWETVTIVELSGDNDWKAEKLLPKERKKDDKTEQIEYRVRELREETALAELMKKIENTVKTQGKAKYNDWIGQLKGSEYYDMLPDSIKNAADQGFDKLAEKLDATEDDLFEKLWDKLGIASAKNRIVYDKDDKDRPGADQEDDDKKDSGNKSTEPNHVSYHVGEYESVVSGGTEDSHVTRYQVKYEKKDDTCTITNKAILEIDVVKRWLALGVDDEDMPESAWVVLMCAPKPGAKDNASGIADSAGVDISGALDFEFPFINPIEGGRDPVSIISEIAVGTDIDIFSKLDFVPKLAIAKVDKDCNWTKHFVVSKYVCGIPMDFKGAELSSEVIRQIVKYLLEMEIYISYNPFDNYISIPTKAIRTFGGITDPNDLLDISKLTGAAKEKAQSLTMDDIKNFGPGTLLDDWRLMANVINLKIDWDTDDTIHGLKIWDDDDPSKRPDTLKIHIKDEEDKEIEGSPIELKKSDFGDDNEWPWSITLPDDADDDADDDAEYFVTEEYPADYEYKDKYILEVKGYDLTNSWHEDKPGRTTVHGMKTWVDKNDQDGIRPEKITVNLLADGEEVAKADTSKAGGWKWIFTDLPVNNDKGKKIQYTVTEDPVEGYETAIDGYNVTNTHTPETFDIKGEKTWDDTDDQDGKRPESITIRLKADGTEVDSKTVTEADGWNWRFERLPKTADGREIVYTVSEDVIPDYTSTVSGTDVTNEYTPGKTQINVNKVWDDDNDADGIRPESITVQLFADGADTGRTLVLSDANKWTGSFIDLDAKKNDAAIVYSVEEKTDNVITGTDGDSTYAGDASGDAVRGFTVTNKHTPRTVKVEGRKTWADDNDRDGKRPESITVRLKADGREVDHKTVTAADGWRWRFTGLPKKSGGRDIVYTISEDVVADYTSAVSGSDAVNTYTPGKTQINVSKVWDDSDNKDNIRPSSVTIRLFADGADTGKTVILSESNKWTGSFTGLDAKKDGRDIAYTVAEKTDSVITGNDGKGTYSFAVSGDAVKGYTVTNKHTPGSDAKTYAVTYKLNGGSFGGSSADIIERYPAGTEITIHAAPTRDGYKFLYWKGSEYKPGDKYTVTEDHTFTAQWEKSDTPSGNPPGSDTPSSNPPSSDTPGSSPSKPATGDSGHYVLWITLFAGSLAVTAALLFRKRREKRRRRAARD